MHKQQIFETNIIPTKNVLFREEHHFIKATTIHCSLCLCVSLSPNISKTIDAFSYMIKKDRKTRYK